jgi:hypothetical protein
MRFRTLLTAAAGVITTSAVGIAAVRMIDQSSPPDAAPIPFTHAVGGPADQVISQTVTAGVDGRLWEVRVPIGCDSGALILEIRDLSVDLPGPTVLYQREYRIRDFPTPVTDDFRTLRILGPPVRLSAGDTYTISLSNPTGSCGIWPGPVGDPYPAGAGWADPNDGPIVPISLGTGRDDIPFVTVMQTR